MLDVVILAAGQGSRMKSDLPKVLHPVGGIPMVQHVINAVDELADRIILVVGHGQADVRQALDGQSLTFVEQTEQLGTGHALAQALPEVSGMFAQLQTENLEIVRNEIKIIRAYEQEHLLVRLATRRTADGH